MTRTGSGTAVAMSPLGSFADAIVQAWEDRRAGLKDDALDSAAAEQYFAALLDREQERLRGAVRLAEPQLSEARREALCQEVDEFMRRTLLPGYARLATAFTTRERNDFYIARRGHAVERIGFGVLGLLVGGFVVWAPFIPLWSKEWVWAAGAIGLFAPELRRWWAWKRYERELNGLVAGADRELERVRVAYLLAEDGGEESRDEMKKEPS